MDLSDIELHITNSFQEGKAYNEWLAYAQSKTGNVLFASTLAKKLKSKGVVSYALQPGCKFARL